MKEEERTEVDAAKAEREARLEKAQQALVDAQTVANAARKVQEEADRANAEADAAYQAAQTEAAWKLLEKAGSASRKAAYDLGMAQRQVGEIEGQIVGIRGEIRDARIAELWSRCFNKSEVPEQFRERFARILEDAKQFDADLTKAIEAELDCKVEIERLKGNQAFERSRLIVEEQRAFNELFLALIRSGRPKLADVRGLSPSGHERPGFLLNKAFWAFVVGQGRDEFLPA